jgi:hypothetical protein
MLSTLSMTTKVLTVGLTALVLSACAHGHHGYRGGGYYYSDHDKHYGRDDRYSDRKYSKKHRYDDRGYDRSYYGRGYDDRSYLDRPYDGRYGYRHERGGYDRYDGYYGRGGYDRDHRVCDSDGDRCYSSRSPYWDYRQYYRNHGYRWQDD